MHNAMWWQLIGAVAALVAAFVVEPFCGGILACLALQWLSGAWWASIPAPSKALVPHLRQPRTARVVVVGNIGAGKTTALQTFQRDLEDRPDNWNKTVCVCEPVDAWAPMLKAMPESEAAWIELQVTIATHYATAQLHDEDVNVAVYERDLMSVALFGGQKRVIAALLLAFAESGRAVLPDVVVHIATPWEVCLGRIEASQRAQAGDDFAANQGAEYFRALHERHHALIKWYAAQGCHVITVQTADTAAIAIAEARQQALDICEAEAGELPQPVTKTMMAALLHTLWPSGNDQ